MIFRAHPTPREIKRYQNRLRYFAMRVRRDDYTPEPVISEPTLVALGAISAHDDQLIDELVRRPVTEAHVPDLADAPKATTPFRLSTGRHVSLDLIGQTILRFSQKFPHLWPPTDAQIRRFRDITGLGSTKQPPSDPAAQLNSDQGRSEQ